MTTESIKYYLPFFPYLDIINLVSSVFQCKDKVKHLMTYKGCNQALKVNIFDPHPDCRGQEGESLRETMGQYVYK